MNFFSSLGQLFFSDLWFATLFFALQLPVFFGFAAYLRRKGLANRTFFVVASLLFLGASAYYFHGIENRSIWEDEDQQAHVVTRCGQPGFTSNTCLVDGAGEAQHPPGAYLYERISFYVLGMRPLAARAPSALAVALATVWLFTLVFVWLDSYLWALVTASVLITHPYVYFYAREGRPHIFALSFSVLVALATYEFFSEDQSRGTRIWLTACICVFLLTCGFQPPIYLAALVLSLVAFRPVGGRVKFLPRLVAYFCACVVGGVVLLPYLIYGMYSTRKSGWAKSAADFSFRIWRDDFLDLFVVVKQYLGAHIWVYIFLMTMGCVLFLLDRTRNRSAKFFMCLFSFTVIFLIFERIVFSGLLSHSFFPRYALAAIPSMIGAACMAALAVGEAVGRLGAKQGWSRTVSLALFGLLIWANLTSPRDQATLDAAKIDWRGLLRDIQAHSAGGDRASFFDLRSSRIEDGGFFGVAFYYQEEGHAQLADFWRWHPPLDQRRKDLSAVSGNLLLAFGFEPGSSAASFFRDHSGLGIWSVSFPTYAVVKFQDKGSATALLTELGELYRSVPAGE